MACSTFILIAIILPIVAATSETNSSLTEDEEEDLKLKVLKAVEIERLKTQILTALGRTETPVIEDIVPSLSEDMLKLLLAEDEPIPQPPENLGHRISFPTNNDFQCFYYNDPSCRRYEYTISMDVMISKWEFWYYNSKSLSSTEQETWIQCMLIGEGSQWDEVDVGGPIYETDEKMWLPVNIPFHKELNSMKGNATCTVEISGISIGEEDQPFFKMTVLPDTYSRKRRSKDGPATKETCRPVTFNVSFAEIGFDEFIVYPKTYNAILCNGYCPKWESFEQRILNYAIQKNANLGEQFGHCWSACCSPKYGTLPFVMIVQNEKTKLYELARSVLNVPISCSCSYGDTRLN